MSALGLSSCAEMVVKNYSPQRGGTVRYSTGWFLADKNRAKAVEEMKTYCQPSRPKLLAENSQREFTGVSKSNSTIGNKTVDTTTTASSENYVYMHFKCVSSKRSVAGEEEPNSDL